VNKKNKWDEITNVFIQVNVWLKTKSGPIGRKRDGEGRVRVEDRAVEGKGPRWSPVVKQGLNPAYRIIPLTPNGL
jgi:hypothetical protein